MDNTSKPNLFAAESKKYGDHYKEHFFEQYKLYLESAEKISNRRQNANSYFLTINTVLIPLLGLSSNIGVLTVIRWWRPLAAFVGVIICCAWWFLVRAHKQLNTGKFKVIHEIEEHLPLALYKYEWEVLGEGRDTKVYFPFSHIELMIPWIFGLIYLVLGLVFLC